MNKTWKTKTMSEIELYHNDVSTCAQKIRLSLFEKGLDWTGHYMDLRAGDQKRPDYLKLNPKGVVPTLVHDGAVIIESSVILEYLEDAFPTPSLRPEAPAARAAMRLWMKRLDEKMHAMVGALSFALAFRHEFLALPDKGESLLASVKDPMELAARRGLITQGVDFPGVHMALAETAATIGQMDMVLADSDFLAGPYSIADIAWTPYMNRLEHLQLGFLWTDAPHVSDWWARLKARDAFEAAITAVEKPERVALMREKAAECGPRVSEIVKGLDAA